MFGTIKIILMNVPGTAFLKIMQCALVAMMAPVSIVATQKLVDSIQCYHAGKADFREVIFFACLLFIVLLIVSGNGLLDNILVISLKRSVNEKLTLEIVNKFRTIEYACFEDNAVADTIKRMGDAPQEKILNIFLVSLNTFTQLIAIIGTAVVFVQVSVWFSVVFLFILIPMLWLDCKAMTIMNDIFDSQSEQERRLDYLSGILEDKNSLFELKISSAVEYILKKCRMINKVVLDERVKTTIRSQKYFAVSTVLVIGWTAFAVFTLNMAVMKQTISIGAFIALIGSAGSVLGMSQELSKNFSDLSRQCLNIRHYYDFLNLPEIREIVQESEIKDPCIEFENVCFKYPKTDKTVLNGVSFYIESGQKVALVGENGEGKTTIIKLLCKLYQPDSGHIRINGRDLNDIPMSQIKQIFSVVFQDFANYSFSLRENVAMGDIDKINNDQEIERALNNGLAGGLLEQMDKGLDTNLGKLDNDGIDLSGGQWQRIAISRACLADSAFIILDEPTASLDPIAESEMYQTFSSALNGKGCLLISHRLASARLVDKIILLRSGVIAESGSHKELMEKNGFYQKMFAAQSSWYVE